MKGKMSAQKAPQGFKAETRELLVQTKESPQQGVIDLFTKRKQKKIEVVAIPEIAKVTSNCRDKVPVLFAISKLGSISFYCFSAVGLPALISMG